MLHCAILCVSSIFSTPHLSNCIEYTTKTITVITCGAVIIVSQPTRWLVSLRRVKNGMAGEMRSLEISRSPTNGFTNIFIVYFFIWWMDSLFLMKMASGVSVCAVCVCTVNECEEDVCLVVGFYWHFASYDAKNRPSTFYWTTIRLRRFRADDFGWLFYASSIFNLSPFYVWHFWSNMATETLACDWRKFKKNCCSSSFSHWTLFIHIKKYHFLMFAISAKRFNKNQPKKKQWQEKPRTDLNEM